MRIKQESGCKVPSAGPGMWQYRVSATIISWGTIPLTVLAGPVCFCYPLSLPLSSLLPVTSPAPEPCLTSFSERGDRGGLTGNRKLAGVGHQGCPAPTLGIPPLVAWEWCSQKHYGDGDGWSPCASPCSYACLTWE